MAKASRSANQPARATGTPSSQPDPIVEMALRIPGLVEAIEALDKVWWADKAGQQPAKIAADIARRQMILAEDFITNNACASLGGAAVQALMALSWTAYGRDMNADDADDVDVFDRIDQLLWSVLRLLKRESGLDLDLVGAGYYVYEDPFSLIEKYSVMEGAQ